MSRLRLGWVKSTRPICAGIGRGVVKTMKRLVKATDYLAGYIRALRFNAIHLSAAKPSAVPITGATFDILTVVFAAELDLLALQARSFDRFLDPAFDGRIFIVVNDLRCEKVIALIERGVLTAYGRWRDRVTIVPFHAVAYRLDPSNGWTVQQAVKLACADLVSQPHYVVFDAKNHLIAPTACARFVDGLANQHFTIDPCHLPRHEEDCSRYFGLDPAEQARRRFVPMTPFVFHTQSVRGLVTCVEAQEMRRLSAVFCRRPFFSEFLLYGAYLDAHAGGTISLYRDVECGTATIWPEDDAAALIAEAAAADAFCFGVHRRYLARIDAAGTALLEAYWRRTGLLGEEERLSGLAVAAEPRRRAPFVRWRYRYVAPAAALGAVLLGGAIGRAPSCTKPDALTKGPLRAAREAGQ